MTISRRRFAAGAAAIGALSADGVRPRGAAWAESQTGTSAEGGAERRVESAEPLDLSWSDLAPGSGGVLYETMMTLGIVQHGDLITGFDQELGGRMTEEYNGRTVRIPGFAIPLDLEGVKAKTLLLVPFVGACIHVPPPPPNQIIYVTAKEAYEIESIFDPVMTTGVINTRPIDTDLAAIGYSLDATRIEPYTPV